MLLKIKQLPLKELVGGWWGFWSTSGEAKQMPLATLFYYVRFVSLDS